jgi:hypothetical protein
LHRQDLREARIPETVAGRETIRDSERIADVKIKGSGPGLDI